MPYILDEAALKSYEGKQGTFIGSKQCVALVQDAMKQHGNASEEKLNTSQWGKGVKVVDSLSTLKPGTLIATFEDDGKYRSRKTGNHAAIYLGSDQTGIKVLDQYSSGNGIQIRTIRKKDFACDFGLNFAKTINGKANPDAKKKPSNNADCYFVIE